jgi:predicted secreted protein
MSVGGAIILFVLIWFAVLFVTLQLTAHSQGDAGEVVPGTPESAPHDFRLKRTAIIVTLVTLPIWGAVVAVLATGLISPESLAHSRWLGG